MNKKISILKRSLLTILPLFTFSSALSFAETHKNKEEPKGNVECKMQFTLKSWSVFYKSGKGKGTITCDNGQRAKVDLRVHGGGVTFGKDETKDGHGTFSKVRHIKELYGSYAMAEAHGGAGDSGASQGLTKGNITLGLTGTGKGVNAGFDFGSFKISKAGSKSK